MNLKERKRKHSLLVIWNVLMYLIKIGCQWRMLPGDFPKWQLVYSKRISRLASGSKEEKFEKRMVFHKTKIESLPLKYPGAMPQGSFIEENLNKL